MDKESKLAVKLGELGRLNQQCNELEERDDLTVGEGLELDAAYEKIDELEQEVSRLRSEVYGPGEEEENEDILCENWAVEVAGGE